MGCKAAVKRTREIKPNLVIVSTGAGEAPPPFPISEGAPVVYAWDALCKKAQVGMRVVVIGGGGTGCETALELARRGAISDETARFLLIHQAESLKNIEKLLVSGPRHVILVEMDRKVGRDVGKSTRWVLLKELDSAGVKIVRNAIVTNVAVTEENSAVVEIEKRKEKKSEQKAKDKETIRCDTAVLAIGVKSERRVAQQLEQLGFDVVLAGDVKDTARALEAIHSGFEAGLSI